MNNGGCGGKVEDLAEDDNGKEGCVRVQDRLIYFLNMFGAFSANTVRGLLYMKLVDLLFSYPLHRPPWLLC